MDYDCIVIGAGHAGIEASHALSTLGLRTLVITQNPDRIGQLSCNPAIGGLSKGNLVREIDALGGLMATLIDQTMIQYRILNRSRGAAVQSPRAQADKYAYQTAARQSLENQPNLSIMMDTVTALMLDKKNTATGLLGSVCGVVTARGHRISAPSVILSAGTFLEGRIFIGEYDAPQGRLGEEAALGLGSFLRAHGFPMGRLKTGTPARIQAASVNYRTMELQDGEALQAFSFIPNKTAFFNNRPTVPCWISYTSETTHSIIRQNIHRSPLYGGKITGTGARYCPSIEDKVMRFPEKERHHVFVEPEGLGTNELYLNGLSTSLPEDVQAAFIRSIAGLEDAVIVRPGYAVEYDYLNPLDLYPTLESKRLKGFFSAGQTNGSSGYEEAAAQGLIAGLNAAAKLLGQPPLVLERSQAYIGVLVDDLTTLGATEPYRMFTSRAEHRLVLRHDTADTRLTPIGHSRGLASDERWQQFTTKSAALETIAQLLKSRDNTAAAQFPAEWVERVMLDQKYAGYIEKENRVIARNAKMERVKLDPAFDYHSIPGLSAEAKEKFSVVRPLTVAQAARISGIRQSDIALLMVLAQRGSAARRQ